MTLTAEEKEARRSGLGGSDIAAIMGLDKNRGPLVIYGSKAAGIDVEIYKDDTASRRGNILEGFVSSIYSERTGRELVEPNSYKKEWRIASLDRIALRKNVNPPRTNEKGRVNFTFIEACPWAERIVEIKCPTSHTFHQWGPETGIPINPRQVVGIPLKYAIQCTWYMHVTHIEKCDLVALLDSEIRIYPIEYNHLFAEAIEEAGRVFMENHVKALVPPPADWLPATHKYLMERFPKHTPGVLLDPTEESMAIASHLRATKAILKEHGRLAEELQNKLCAIIGDAQGIDGICTWNSVSGRVNWDGLMDYLIKEGILNDSQVEKLKTEYRAPNARRFRMLGDMDS